MAQQLTGINSITNYGQTVLVESGFSESGALVANIAPGVIAVINVVALVFVMTQVPETRGSTLEALEEDVTTGAIYLVNKK